VRHVNVPGPQDETIQKQFEELLSPAIHAQSAFYRSLSLRDRILNLPLMIAAILAMLWRQIPSVCELTRMPIERVCCGCAPPRYRNLP
jgi:hypothetical protein